MSETRAESRLPFHGASMAPLFRGANQVLVDLFPQPRPLGPEFRQGEILLYKDAHGEWVCHRLIGVGEGQFLLKGDATVACEKVSALSIWGRVKGFASDGGDQYLRDGIAMEFLCSCQRRQSEPHGFFVRKFNRLLCFAILSIHRRFFLTSREKT